MGSRVEARSAKWWVVGLALIVMVASGCAAAWHPVQIGNLGVIDRSPIGDAARGEALFRKGRGDTPPCIGCHTLTPGAFGLGPVMAGISKRAGTRVPGLSADAYLFQSITDPRAYIVAGYRVSMYPYFARDYSAQDIADLIAFLKTQ